MLKKSARDNSGGSSPNHRVQSKASHNRSQYTVKNGSVKSYGLKSQISKYDESQFNPYFFPAAKSVIGARSEAGNSVTSAARRMSKEVQDRLYGKVPHMCTRLCSTFHFGPRLRPTTSCKQIHPINSLYRGWRHNEESWPSWQRGPLIESVKVQ